MNCEAVKGLLSAYLDRELPASEQEQVSAHLEACPLCSAELADLETLVSRLRGLGEVTPPAWLRQKVMEKIRQESLPKPGFFARLFHPLTVAFPLGAVATVLVVAIALVLYRESSREQMKTIQQEEVRQTAQQAVPVPTAPQKQPGAKPPLRAAEQPVAKTDAPATPAAPAPAPAEAERAGSLSAGDSVREYAPAVREARQGNEYKALSKEEADSRLPAAPAKMRSEAAGKAVAPPVVLTVRVSDPEAAVREVESLLKDLGGRDIRHEAREGSRDLLASLEGSRLAELAGRLRKIGNLAEKVQDRAGESVSIRIMIREDR